MANKGKNSNTSQFFITFNACPKLDGKYVVFGECVEGLEVLQVRPGAQRRLQFSALPILHSHCIMY